MNATETMIVNGTTTAIDDYLDALLDNALSESDTPAMALEVVRNLATAEVEVAAAPAPAPEISLPAPVTPPAPALQSIPAATAPVAARSATALSTSHRWLRVAVGADSYAIELLCVQEVVRLAPIVAMRGANRAVLGVMNLRGRIVPVFDLGRWLDAGCVQPDERSRIVVIERDDELIGVLVSLVEDVVTLGRDRIEPPLAGSDPGVILGIARVGPTPTVLLDANVLFG